MRPGRVRRRALVRAADSDRSPERAEASMTTCGNPWLAPLVLCALLGGATPGPASAQVPAEIHWTRDSAEHDAIFLQVYRAATAQLERAAAGQTSGSWAVILDADETVLDNSEHFRVMAAHDNVAPAFDAEAWGGWVREARAPALPGSAAFIARVHSLGGRVVIVTNRIDELCEPTRQNFRNLAIEMDAVLCHTSSSNKNPRYESVQAGTAAIGLPALTVLMWIGDNIQDFPGLMQPEARARGQAALTEFGVRFFVLPNPMYGSWEGNPIRN
ncbi:MAG: hypothetical protein EXR95_07680 [Gemmatimonadetes bacterium]|nr:hypothetical protein [Gemmatimonadota bacterium]